MAACHGSCKAFFWRRSFHSIAAGEKIGNGREKPPAISGRQRDSMPRVLTNCLHPDPAFNSILPIRSRVLSTCVARAKRPYVRSPLTLTEAARRSSFIAFS